MHEEGEAHRRHRKRNAQLLGRDGSFCGRGFHAGHLADALGLHQIFLADQLGGQQHHIAGRCCPIHNEVHDRLQRRARLAARELLDRAVECALVDSLDRLRQGVEADDRDGDASSLGCLDGTQRHVVVGRNDCLHIRVGGQTVLGHGQPAVAVEVARLLTDHLDVSGRVDHIVQTRRAIDGWRGTRRAEQLDDLGAVREEAQDRFTLRFAAEHVVGTDMRQQAVDAVGAAVDGDHRDPCVDHLLDDRGDPFVGARADDQAVVAERNHTFQVSHLLGRVVLAVERDDLDVADLRRFVPHLFLHVHEEGEAHRRHRKRNAVDLGFSGRLGSSFAARRRGSRRRTARQHQRQQNDQAGNDVETSHAKTFTHSHLSL